MQRDTLIRYLLDELHSYEEDHSDALCPVQREAQTSLLGEHVLVQPVSTQEFRLAHTSIHSRMKGMQDEMGSVKATVDQMSTTMNAFMNMHLTQPSRASCHFSCPNRPDYNPNSPSFCVARYGTVSDPISVRILLH